MTTEQIWERVIEAAGSTQAVGDLVGRSKRRIYQLVKANEPIPTGWCPALAKATKIPLHELRPDQFATDA